uniref:Uncharacterized protein n=1 Tax=Anguilla anguilla TaxID=7936 RepID=A0A0E9Y0Q5_ANGAN
MLSLCLCKPGWCLPFISKIRHGDNDLPFLKSA